MNASTAPAGRTRAEGLTLEMRQFLAELDRRGGLARPAAMDMWATGKQSAARQRCKRAGHVDLVWDDKGRRIWKLLISGRRALADAEMRREPDA